MKTTLTDMFRLSLPAFMLGLLLLIPWLPAAWFGALQFDRLAIQNGEWWRLLTAHWLHLSWLHLLMNAMGLLLCFYIGGRGFRATELLLFLPFSLLLTGLGLLCLAEDLSLYVGLSGVLHGLLWLALLRTPHYSVGLRLLAMLLVLGKTGWEQSHAYDAMALADWLGGRVEPRAHLYGLLTGMLWGIAVWAGRRGLVAFRNRSH